MGIINIFKCKKARLGSSRKVAGARVKMTKKSKDELEAESLEELLIKIKQIKRKKRKRRKK